MKVLVRHLLLVVPVAAALTAAVLIAWTGTAGSIDAGAASQPVQMTIPF